MLGLIIARCCAKTRIDEKIPMLTRLRQGYGVAGEFKAGR